MKTKLTPVLLSMTLLAVTGGALRAQTTGDHAAVHASAQKSQGGTSLTGVLPPLLGQPTAFHIQAPGHAFGALFLSGMANPAGVGTYIGPNPLAVYCDPLSFLMVMPFPMPLGNGTMQLPLPPDPRLTGLDLAWQAVTFSPDLRSVGSSNLVLSNLGTTITGPAEFHNFAPNGWFNARAACDTFTYEAPSDGTFKAGGKRGKKVDLEVLVNGKPVYLIHQGTEDWSTPTMELEKGDKVEIRPVQKGGEFSVTGSAFARK